MTHLRLSLLCSVLLAAMACVDPLPETGRPCPCAEGWTCCPSLNVCLAADEVCPIPDTQAPPTPTLELSTLSPTRAAHATLTGATEADARVLVFRTDDCAGAAIVTTVADGQGQYRVDAPLVQDIENVLSVRAEDSVRNPSGCSQSVAVTQDSTAPVQPRLTALQPPSPSNMLTDATTSGAAEPRAWVQLFSDGRCTVQAGDAVLASADGAFEVTVPVAANATTELRAVATDAAGNSSPCSEDVLRFTHDDLAPVAPVLTSPPASASERTAQLSGVAEPEARVSLFLGTACTGAPVATATATAAGAFSAMVEVDANQPSSVAASAVDDAGNVSGCSGAITYVHDDRAPLLARASTFPTSPGNWSSPTIMGQAEPGARVEVCVEPCDELSRAISTSANAEGNFATTLTVATNQLSQLRVTARDLAGNPSSTLVLDYQHDDIPPPAPLLISFRGAVGADPDIVEVFGVAEEGALLQFYRNTCFDPSGPRGTFIPLGRAPGSETARYFLANVVAPVGAYVGFTASDPAGNTSPCSNVQTYGYLDHVSTRWLGRSEALGGGSALAGDVFHTFGLDGTVEAWELRAVSETERYQVETWRILERGTAPAPDLLAIAAAPEPLGLAVWRRPETGRVRFATWWASEANIFGDWTVGGEVPTADAALTSLHLVSDEAAGFALIYAGEDPLAVSRIWIQRYTRAEGWSAPAEVAVGELQSVAVAEGAGIAIALTREASGGGVEVVAWVQPSRAAVPQTSVVGTVSSPAQARIAIDHFGHRYLVSSGGSAGSPVWAVHGTPEGWTAPAPWPLELPAGAEVTDVVVASNEGLTLDRGAVAVVGAEDPAAPGARRFWVSKTSDGTWDPVEELRAPHYQRVRRPRAMPAPGGRGVVVFTAELPSDLFSYPQAAALISYCCEDFGGGGWSQPELLTRRSGDGVSVDLHGRTTYGWPNVTTVFRTPYSSGDGEYVSGSRMEWELSR